MASTYFFSKCAKNYSFSNEQLKNIKEIFEVYRNHKNSAMEFVKNDKVVILSDNLKTKVLDIVLIKKYLLLAKEVLMKVNIKVSN